MKCRCLQDLLGELSKYYNNPEFELVTFKDAQEFVDLPGVSLFYTRNRKRHRTIIAVEYCPWCGEKMIENLHDNDENIIFEEE